jgi:hypothetical protein
MLPTFPRNVSGGLSAGTTAAAAPVASGALANDAPAPAPAPAAATAAASPSPPSTGAWSSSLSPSPAAAGALGCGGVGGGGAAWSRLMRGRGRPFAPKTARPKKSKYPKATLCGTHRQTEATIRQCQAKQHHMSRATAASKQHSAERDGRQQRRTGSTRPRFQRS